MHKFDWPVVILGQDSYYASCSSSSVKTGLGRPVDLCALDRPDRCSTEDKSTGRIMRSRPVFILDELQDAYTCNGNLFQGRLRQLMRLKYKNGHELTFQKFGLYIGFP